MTGFEIGGTYWVGLMLNVVKLSPESQLLLGVHSDVSGHLGG